MAVSLHLRVIAWPYHQMRVPQFPFVRGHLAGALLSRSTYKYPSLLGQSRLSDLLTSSRTAVLITTTKDGVPGPTPSVSACQKSFLRLSAAADQTDGVFNPAVNTITSCRLTLSFDRLWPRIFYHQDISLKLILAAIISTCLVLPTYRLGNLPKETLPFLMTLLSTPCSSQALHYTFCFPHCMRPATMFQTYFFLCSLSGVLKARFIYVVDP